MSEKLVEFDAHRWVTRVRPTDPDWIEQACMNCGVRYWWAEGADARAVDPRCIRFVPSGAPLDNEARMQHPDT